MRKKSAFITMATLIGVVYCGAAFNPAKSAEAATEPIVAAQLRATDTAQPDVSRQPTATKKKSVTGKKNVTGAKGGGSRAVALTSGDCKAVGGKVITLNVNDIAADRCGSSRMYCRMPDTNAVCIENAK